MIRAGARRDRRAMVAVSAGVILYLIGSASNLVAALSNGARMPVVGGAGYSSWWEPAGPSTHLSLLVDRFPIPTGIASLGDAVVWVGELTVLLASVLWLARR